MLNGRPHVGFVYDPACLEHDSGPGIVDAAAPWLPTPNYEGPERLRNAHRVLERSGRLAQLEPVPARRADESDLELVHTPAHVRRIRETRTLPGVVEIADATWGGPATWEAALGAAGATLAAADAVAAGSCGSAYALVRPPGHHATADEAGGTCYFNNVAIAAEHLRARHGVGRIAIVDWDVHHGNGTQAIFDADPDVLFVSIHQEDFYPRDSGRVHERGSGAGRGATVNVPLPAGAPDAAYREVFSQIVVPAVEGFAPEVLLVSSGQDAAATDPLGRMSVSAEGFRAMTATTVSLARRLCGGRLLLVQEGGYNPAHVPWCVLATVEAMLGVEPSFAPDPIPADGPLHARPCDRAAIERAAAAHWRVAL